MTSGFVDLVARVVGCRQAGGVARRLQTPHQTRGGQHAQHVGDALAGHLTGILTHDTGDRASVGVRMVVHHGQHRDPGTRHTQSNPAQHALGVRTRRHAFKSGPFSGIRHPRVTGQSSAVLPTAGNPAGGPLASRGGTPGAFEVFRQDVDLRGIEDIPAKTWASVSILAEVRRRALLLNPDMPDAVTVYLYASRG
jgi:hypothetical protein